MTNSLQQQMQLADALPFGLEPVAPPADLADLINTFFVTTTDIDQIEDMMPSYSAQIMVYPRGRSDLRPDTGSVYYSDTVTVTAPLLRAAPYTLFGPAKIVGMSLTPLGWQRLSGLAVDEVSDQILRSRDVLPLAEVEKLEGLAAQYREGKASVQQICDALADLVRNHGKPINPEHRRFVNAVMAWLSSELNPPLQALYDEVEISTRSAQRLCKRYFGVSPSRLVKRYRAIRAAMLLANPDLSQSMLEEVRGIYFDQAHLIRDIRRYTGRTPTALRESSLLQDSLDPQAHGKGAKILR